MRQQNNPYRSRDTTLMSGWLFADLLLGLTMIFLVAAPRILPPPTIPPVLTVNTTALDPTSGQCQGSNSAARCVVIVGETVDSRGSMTWTASNDMSNTVSFSPASGILTPGASMRVTIAAIPCQNGSFTFSGSRGAMPVTVGWKCTPLQVRLEPIPRRFTLTVHDVNGLLNGSSQDQDIKNQVIHQPVLQGRSVGLVIAYGGAPGDADIPQAQAIAAKIYTILQSLAKEKEGAAFQRASYYVSRSGNLYTLGNDPSTVEVDVYLFAQ